MIAYASRYLHQPVGYVVWISSRVLRVVGDKIELLTPSSIVTVIKEAE